jgi:hypothetical protein
MTKADWLGIKIATLMLVVAIGDRQASGMGMESFGPAGEHISRSADWPKGVEDVLRHPSRVYWRDVNGSEWAYYDGDLATVNELLALYSKIEMAEHPVVILAGKQQAASFHRKLTPYTVEFVVPGRMEIHFRQRDGRARQHPQVPTLIIALDEALAEDLDSLKIPKNVTLQNSVSGVAPGESEPQAVESIDPALWQRVTEFVNDHPQRARVPSPQELLEALRKVDAEYAQGFTARGTRTEPESPNKLIAWTVTMDSGKLVVEQRDVEDADHPPAAGRIEYTQYLGPERMGSIDGSRLWIDGKLSEARPHATFEPVGSTYDLLVGRLLWPLGRGFSRRIDRVTSVTPDSDGLLRVKAECGDGILVNRWELRIDSRADFLVCQAKGFSRDEKTPAYTVETAGVLTGGGRSVAHTARWIEGASAPASISVTSVSGEADEELIRQTEKRLDELPGMGE